MPLASDLLGGCIGLGHHHRATVGGAGVVGAAGGHEGHHGHSQEQEGFLFHVVWLY